MADPTRASGTVFDEAFLRGFGKVASTPETSAAHHHASGIMLARYLGRDLEHVWHLLFMGWKSL